ncbi:unnamed protein product [Rhizophagus irregularis]|nr:unnamed protein product [Rhizophagus irregularis]
MKCERCGKYLRFEWCKSCQINNLQNNFTNWTSGNEKIDNLIQEMQLEILRSSDNITEWIPYDQFNDIIENQDTRVNLKCLHNPRNITDEFLNEARDDLYGISQNSDTKDYILVLRNKYCNECSKCFIDEFGLWCKSCQINDFEKNFTNWTSGNEKIENSIQEMQLNINGFNDIIVEWIPYNQFNNIKELEKDEFTIIYSAIWNDGRLFYNYINYCDNKYIRRKNTKVILKLYNSQNTTTDEFLNEVNSSNEHRIYGISQNPNIRDYIIVFPNKYYCEKCKRLTDNFYFYKWCKPCQKNALSRKCSMNWTSKYERINNLIQEMQSKINTYNDIVFEWIPYNQFINIKEIGEG